MKIKKNSKNNERKILVNTKHLSFQEDMQQY